MNKTERRDLAEYKQGVVGRTAQSLASGSNVWRHSTANYAPAYLAALEAEQERRCVADVVTARVLAGREGVARSMATDDLQDMLPDFEQVAAVCGIRPEDARLNRVIVVAELRRRGVEAA